VFISWIRHHGRSADLAAALGMPAVFLDGGSGNTLKRYVRQWRDTRNAVRSASPRTIIVMQPPLPALLAVVSTRQGREALLIGDLHTGALENPKWKWASGPMLRILRKRGLAVVTNAPLGEKVEARGVRALVLNDLIPVPADVSAAPDDESLVGVLSQQYVLVPLAYANDEPVDELLTAAASDPSITWVLTGRSPASVKAAASQNVRFTGFVTNDDYTRLLDRAAVVAALTDREFTMQRAGYEALGAATPLITAKTRTLHDYFGDAAVYMNGTASSIRDAAVEALGRLDELGERMEALRLRKVGEESAALQALRELVATSVSADGR
jgi:hypothetical protein